LAARTDMSVLHPGSCMDATARTTSPSAAHGAAEESSAFRITMLGGFSVAVGTHVIPADAWQRRSARTVVKVLALTPHQRMHREELADLLWPDADVETSSNNLRVALHAARRALRSATGDGPALLAQVDGHIALHPSRVWTDVAAFQDAAERAHRAGTPSAYRAAIARYTGDLLPEDRYADWASAPRERLRNQYIGLLIGLADALAQHGTFDDEVEALEQVLALEPTHEEAATRLMLVLTRNGQRQRAIQVYQRLAAAVHEDVGASPSPETQRVYTAVLAGSGDVRTTGRANEPAVEDHDHNLREPLTRFIGREDLLSTLKTTLDHARLVTLTGPGGCGKTRLALATAQAVRQRFTDGAWFIDLGLLNTPEAIPQAVASAMKISLPASDDPAAALAELLRSRCMLLVLDNCEHLIAGTARLAERLLLDCSHLRVLATSREALHVDGEVGVRVPMLDLPPDDAEPERIAGSEAVSLFVDRARQRQPDFALTPATQRTVSTICRRLDGWPLAIELAAARVSMFPVEQLLTRLDAPLQLLSNGSRTVAPRQQTLRATLDWSYALLEERERTLFMRLSTFAGGWTLEAAEAICTGGGIERQDVLMLLAGLVEKSLVRVEPGPLEARYLLLDPVRHYAQELLHASDGGSALPAAHARYYTQMSEAAEQGLQGAEQERWLVRIEDELANLRAALGWMRATGDTLGQLRLASALVRWWWIRGYASEGRSWLEQALHDAHGSDDLDASIVAKGLQAAGNLARMQGDTARALDLLEACMERQREIGDPRALADVLNYLSAVLGLRGDAQRAIGLAQEGLALRRSLGDTRSIALSLGTLGELSFGAGRADDAIPYLEEALPLYRAIGDTHSVAITLNNLGEALRAQRQLSDAMTRFHEALALFRELDAMHGVAYLLANIGDIAREQGQAHDALRNYRDALALFEELGYQEALIATAGRFGILVASQGQPEQALEMLAAEETLRTTAGFSAVPSEHAEFVTATDHARAALGAAAADAAWHRGQRFTLEQLLAHCRAVEIPPAATVTSGHPLSQRETDVAQLAARGLTNQQIAGHLGISTRTVETHVSNVLRKLAVTSRAELATRLRSSS
jgi:predicted ATPase/DNA-binding SARP family transcriptional activator/DNA-binding CsgD family transcriptional regulator